MITYLEWIAFGGSLLSTYLYGSSGIRGPIAGLLTCVAFILFGYVADLLAAIISNIIFLVIHGKNLKHALDRDMDRDIKKVTRAINMIVDKAHGAAKDAGWWNGTDVNDVNVVPAKLCLIHSEVSEAMEGHRKNLMDDKLPHRTMLEVELADAVIRICDLAGKLELDLGGAIAEKMAFNAIRPDHKLENRAKSDGKKY